MGVINGTVRVFLLLLITTAGAAARTWQIEPDGTGDAPTIQAGIDSAAVGDTVLLADMVFTGTGNWNLDFLGKAITVRSGSGNPSSCTIDLGGYYAHRGFYIHSGEGPDSRIEGLTIADGFHSQGAGILVQNASPTVVDCRILRCTSQSDGGGVSCTNGASPIFRRCTIADNDTYFYGGGVRLDLGDGSLHLPRSSYGDGGLHNSWSTGCGNIKDQARVSSDR